MSKIQELLGVRSFILITGMIVRLFEIFKHTFWGWLVVMIPPGASRGLGQAIAVELSEVVAVGSTLLLLARNKKLLKVTRDMCRAVRPGLAVEVKSLDLSTADKESFEKVLLKHKGSGDHEVAMAQWF